MKLPLTLQNKIIEFLISLPNLHDSDSQRAMLYWAGMDSQLQAQLPFGTPLVQFIPLLVTTLLNYGKLDNGRYALVAVLDVTKNYVGQDGKAYCESLIQEFYTALNRETSQEQSFDISPNVTNQENKDTNSYQKLVELQIQYDLISEKILLLKTNCLTQNNVSVCFKLEKQVEDEEKKRTLIMQEIHSIKTS